MYDVTIIGGSFSGLYLGRLLGKAGLDVLIIEEHEKPILQCSGVVSKKFLRYVEMPKTIVEREIDSARIISPSGYSIDLKFSALVLDRIRLDEFLDREARNVCAMVREKATALEIGEDVKVKTNEGEYKSKLLVGADGPGSFVRTQLRLGVPKYTYYGRFAYVKERTRSRCFEIYFNKLFSPDFFAWKIPRSIKVEYGLATTDNPNIYYQRFMRGRNADLLSEHGGIIPIGITKSYFRRGLLVGDACGQVKPITGGGLLYSAIACRIAADVLVNAVKTENYDLSLYEKKWKKVLGNEISKGLWIRHIYRHLSNKQIDALIKNLEVKDVNMDFIATQLFKMSRRRLLGLAWKTIRG